MFLFLRTLNQLDDWTLVNNFAIPSLSLSLSFSLSPSLQVNVTSVISLSRFFLLLPRLVTENKGKLHNSTTLHDGRCMSAVCVWVWVWLCMCMCVWVCECLMLGGWKRTAPSVSLWEWPVCSGISWHVHVATEHKVWLKLLLTGQRRKEKIFFTEHSRHSSVHLSFAGESREHCKG